MRWSANINPIRGKRRALLPKKNLFRIPLSSLILSLFLSFIYIYIFFFVRRIFSVSPSLSWRPTMQRRKIFVSRSHRTSDLPFFLPLFSRLTTAKNTELIECLLDIVTELYYVGAEYRIISYVGRNGPIRLRQLSTQ